MKLEKPIQYAHHLRVPLIADSVLAPFVQYGDELTAVHFRTDDERWGRITFERLDSIKVSRGEIQPFEPAPSEPIGFHWVTTISNSAWLQERYEYEKKHYGDAYNFGGSVDEMITEFSHYVFSFHDEFVEALAAGIWFESSDTSLVGRVKDSMHPLNGLANIKPAEQFESSGTPCFVRRNPLPLIEIERAAELCTQVILEVGADFDGNRFTGLILSHRVRNGIAKTFLRDCPSNIIETYDKIPSLSEIRPRIDQWVAQVNWNRRKQIGDIEY